MSGEQEIIAVATDKCSKAEWREMCRATNLVDKGTADKVPSTGACALNHRQLMEGAAPRAQGFAGPY